MSTTIKTDSVWFTTKGQVVISAWLRKQFQIEDGSKAIVQSDREGGYEELCREIGRFFKTGKSPVRAEETIEIFAFMEAADESKRQSGAPVSLANVLAKAKAEAATKIAE